MANRKISISIDENLLAKLDDFANSNFLSRSGFISLAANTYLNQQEVCQTLGSLRSTLDKIGDAGGLDAESEAELQAFMQIAGKIGQ